jgi:hypothetical protein
LGFVALRNQPAPVRIRLQRTATNLLVEYAPSMRFVKIFEVELGDTPDRGYFTLFAETNVGFVDNNDVTYFRTTPLSDYDRAGIDAGLLVENRKTLDSNWQARRERKIARRQAKLKTMHKVVEAMSKHQNDVTRTGGQPDFRDMFRVLDEAGERSVEGVTIDHLKVFVGEHVDGTIGEAGKNIEGAMDEIDGFKDGLADSWTYLRQALLQLASDTRESLSQLERECIDIGWGFPRFGEISLAQLGAAATGNAVPDRPTDKLPAVLSIFALVELIGYLIFFFIKHRKTRGFKKIE